jgi:fatty-acyl-CoA synthase
MTDGTMQPYGLTIDKFLDHAAKWHPTVEVVTRLGEGDLQRIDYAGLRKRAKGVSSILANMGLTRGNRVATLAWNTQSHLEAWYAIMGMGCVCHTLNPRLPAATTAKMLHQSQAEVLIVSADLALLAADILKNAPVLERVLVIDGPAEALSQAVAGQQVDRLEPLDPDICADVEWGNFDEFAPCGLCFTSGTTGTPKGVTYTHRGNYLHTLRQLQADVAGIRQDDSILIMVPMFHANAWGLPFAAPAAGAKLVLPGRHSDGASMAQLILEENVTIAVGVPTVWFDLFDHLEKTGNRIPSLQRIMVGGAPMPQVLMDRIESHGVEVQTTWGMTELSPLGTATPPGDPLRSRAASGRPALGVDLMLANADGDALPEQRDVEGHLWVRGPAVVEKYLGHDGPVTRDGWFNTGDLARIDQMGRVEITGRSKDLIKSGGEWINPTEIEALVGALPEVALAAVIGREDPKWGERPILLVELMNGAELSDADMVIPLRNKVASWWIPDEVIRLPAMPLAATGKIDKLRLRREYCRI